MNKKYEILVHKIRAFKRRYYLFLFYRGLFLFLISFLIIFSFVNLLEFKLFLSSEWRKILFFTSVLFLTVVFLRYVLLKGLMLLGLFQKLNERKASLVIEKLMPEIKDKLLNIIELKDYNEEGISKEITEAAIIQKIEDIKIYDFAKAVKMNQLKSLIKYLSASFIIVVSLQLIDRNLYRESANRLIHYNREYIKPSSYSFLWINEVDGVDKGSDYNVVIECRGRDIPAVMYINIGGNNFVMKALPDGMFEYRLNTIVNPLSFYITDLSNRSDIYHLNVIPVALISSFTAVITVPGYTGLKNYEVENIGDIEIPKGSHIEWTFDCFDTDSLRVIFNNQDSLDAFKSSVNVFKADKTVFTESIYDIQIKRKGGRFESSMNFRLKIKEDEFPEINVVQIQDSNRVTRLYFSGSIHDDYGFSNLSFHIVADGRDTFISLPHNEYVLPQDFYYNVDLLEFKNESNILNYYFTVSDNDEVTGTKTTSSESMTYTFPSAEELKMMENAGYLELENLISESRKLTEEINNEIRQLQINNIENNISDWEKSQQVENILEKKEALESVLEKIESAYKSMTGYQNTFSRENEALVKKQEEIQNLLENIMTDELRKLLEEFSQLANEFNEKRLNELSKQMDISFEDLSKQLDRNLQMLQKMKIENNLVKIIDDVKKSEKNIIDDAEQMLEKDQMSDFINDVISDYKDIEDIEQRLLDILEENNKLERPLNFDNFSNEFGDVKEELRNSLNELQRGNKRKSSEGLRNTSEKLKNLAFSMKQMLGGNNSEQNNENIQNLKQILKNLLALSFDQEYILTGITNASAGDPDIKEYIRKQRDIAIQSEMVRDSLYALAKRAPQIDHVVNNELMGMSINLVRSSELLNEGSISQANTNQRLVLTAANNLTLLLSEILKQLENMGEGEPGDGEETKNGKGGIQKLKGQSENLREQLQRMIDQLKDGNNPVSKDLSESLMMHEMMQQLMRELMNNGSIGESSRKHLQEIDRMLEQNRKDLMNRNVTQVMVRRQNEILSKLLEAEKSENERDKDDERESNKANEQFYSNPALMFKEENKKDNTIEYIQRDNIKLNNFYLDKFNGFIQKFNQEKSGEHGTDHRF